jgi:hypothetical protein
VEWVQVLIAALAGLGVGGWWARRHASQEAEIQRNHSSAEARATREHATAEARATRQFEIRLNAYREASQFLSENEMWVRLTEPLWEPAPDPPKYDPEEGVKFGGTIAVTASDEVRTAMRAAVDAVLAFEGSVRKYRRSTRPGAKIDPATNPGGDMHSARLKALAAIEHVQTVMRDELAGL